MSEYYILDENDMPVLEPNKKKRHAWEDKAQMHAGNEWIGEYHVSTVFLSRNVGTTLEPLLWETMVFCDNPSPEFQDRCGGGRTEAKLMHVRMVKKIRRLIPK